MKRLPLKIVFLLLTLNALQAKAGTNSWSTQGSGGVVSVGGQTLSGRTLYAPLQLPSAARVKSIAWRIKLLSPPPLGLQIKLCNEVKCLKLPALSGVLHITSSLAAAGPFKFIYWVDSQGRLTPALSVVNNQLTINYQ